jgi:hypothetical protein
MRRVLSMRKNRMLTGIFILMCFMLVSGCGYINVSVDRSTLSVEKALIGHWISQGTEATNYYISSDKLIKVKKDGSTEAMTYKIVETNDKTNEIKLIVTTAGGSEQNKKIQFTTDKKSMTETTEILTIVTNTEDFKYVDSKTTP